jgi:hypothetical protein
MSEHHFTPESLRPNIELILGLLDTVVSWLPTTAGDKPKVVLKAIKNLLEQDWVLNLLCYLINYFADKEPSKEEVAVALQNFVNQAQVSGTLPVTP